MKHRHKKTLHRHTHPIHWHASMFVAIAAILLTSVKSSGEMMRALSHAAPAHTIVLDSMHMREAETRHAPIMISLARNIVYSGG